MLYFKNSVDIPKPEALMRRKHGRIIRTHLLLGEEQGIKAVFRIHMFLGLPDPDPLVKSMDPDPSIIKQKY